MVDHSHFSQIQGSLSVAIFSYNRGKYLKNLLNSLDRHLPEARVVVYDDDSDDAYTKQVLAETHHRVSRGAPVAISKRHGNLYGNMQKALEDCETRFLLFLQDDNQIVRDVGAGTFAAIEAAFAHQDVAFARMQLLKQRRHSRLLSQLAPDPNARLYWPNVAMAELPWGHVYWDVILADTAKLRAANWTFQESERDNQIQARGLFRCAPYLADPFVSYCPEVSVYRNRKLYLSSRIVDLERQGAICRYIPMTADENRAFTTRPLDIMPLAEDFLKTDPSDVKRPFEDHDYARTWWLKALYKVESRLWRIWASLRG